MSMVFTLTVSYILVLVLRKKKNTFLEHLSPSAPVFPSQQAASALLLFAAFAW